MDKRLTALLAAACFLALAGAQDAEAAALPLSPVVRKSEANGSGLPPAQRRAMAARPAATTTAVTPDYPGATWIPASPDNYTQADRPHDWPIDMIVIHDTEGSYGSAIQEFQDGATQASAHYVVSDQGQVTQMVKEHDVAWHAGNWDYNTRSIGIEHEGYAYTPGYYTQAMYQASAQIAASICSRYGVPMDRNHVIGHYQVPDPDHPGQFGGDGNHTDPGPYWDWTTYMSLAQGYANALPSLPALMPDLTALTSDHNAVLIWEPARSCRTPITGYTVTGQPGNLVQHLAADATRAYFSGLPNGVEYTFTVTATDADGSSSATLPPVLVDPLPFSGLYTVDAYGGVHGDSSQPLAVTAYWPGWTIARQARTLPVASGAPQTGFVLDGYGGLHSFGAPLTETAGASGHRWGWDIARDLAFLPNGQGGLVLDGYGGLHPFWVNGSNAPIVVTGAAYWGWDIARKLVIFPDGSGGYVLDGWGGIHPFGINGAPPVAAASLAGGGYWQGWDIARDIVLVPGDGGHSGYLLDGFGGIHPFHPTTDGSVLPAAVATQRWDFDFARRIWLTQAATAAAPTGYVLDGSGGLSAVGAVPLPDHPYWVGFDIAVGLVGQ
jgi:N-acetylmuramoyl-L-alanine amidase